MVLTTGSRLGPYEVIAPIGAGGMGEVYRGRDASLSRDVAIKVLPAATASDAEGLARFKREAQVLASLNHPNIAQVFGFESATLPDGSTIHFLAMELVEGEDLAQRLRNGAIPLDDALPIAKQIAEGLDEAHERGIVHRDLKPANIKVTPDGKVKILDFGLAKAVEASTISTQVSDSRLANSPTISRHMTEAGIILGTAAYMSPEQARGKPIDKRGDIWAFGVVLFEMLTGRRLFTGETVSDVLASVLRSDPDWAALPAGTPPVVSTLIRRCLERDPKKRLRDIGEASLVLADPHRVSSSSTTAADAPSRTRERAAWITAAVASILAAGLGLRAVRDGRPASNHPLYFSLSTEASEVAPTAAAISPDGMRVAFLGRLPGAAMNTIFTRDLNQGTARPLAGTEGAAEVPAFSPDGKWLAFNSFNRGLKRIPSDGGTAIDLASGDFRYADAAWLDDGRILLTGFDWEQPGVLYQLPESGGTPAPIAGPKELATERVSFPRALPGGRAVLLQTGRDLATLSVQILATGERKVIAQNGRFAQFVGSSLVWIENDKIVAAPFDLSGYSLKGPPITIPSAELEKGGSLADMALSASGSLIFLHAPQVNTNADVPEAARRLIWIDRLGKRTPGPSVGPVAAGEPRLSPDETHALVDGAGGEARSDVWSIDLQRGTLLRLSFTTVEDETGVWSPNGAWVGWAGTRTGQGRGLYRRRGDGSGQEEKLWDCGPFHCHAAAWTPDGRGVLMTVDRPKTGFDIFLITLDAKASARPLLADAFNETNARLSPDGRWLAYTSDESGRSEVYAQAFPGLGSKVQISLTGGQEPVWRPGGGEIVYRSTTSREFISVTVTGKEALAISPPRVLTSDLGLARGDLDHTAFGLSRDGRILTVQRPPEDTTRELGFVLGWAQAAGLIR